MAGGLFYEAFITLTSGPRARISGLAITGNIFSEPQTQYWNASYKGTVNTIGVFNRSSSQNLRIADTLHEQSWADHTATVATALSLTQTLSDASQCTFKSLASADGENAAASGLLLLPWISSLEYSVFFHGEAADGFVAHRATVVNETTVVVIFESRVNATVSVRVSQ